jgi:hypothetical protein
MMFGTSSVSSGQRVPGIRPFKVIDAKYAPVKEDAEESHLIVELEVDGNPYNLIFWNPTSTNPITLTRKETLNNSGVDIEFQKGEVLSGDNLFMYNAAKYSDKIKHLLKVLYTQVPEITAPTLEEYVKQVIAHIIGAPNKAGFVLMTYPTKQGVKSNYINIRNGAIAFLGKTETDPALVQSLTYATSQGELIAPTPTATSTGSTGGDVNFNEEDLPFTETTPEF